MTNSKFETQIVNGVEFTDATKGLALGPEYELTFWPDRTKLSKISKEEIAEAVHTTPSFRFQDRFVLFRALGCYGLHDIADLVRWYLPRSVEAYLEADELQRAQELKDLLICTFVEWGLYSPDKVSSVQSEKYFQGKLASSETLKRFQEQELPIEVMGQLLTIELFSKVTDEKKREELRAWATRNLLRPYMGVLKGKKPPKTDVTALIDALPAQIFKDPLKVSNALVIHHVEQRLMQQVTDLGLDAGMAHISQMVAHAQNEDIRQFLQTIEEQFLEVATFKVNPNDRFRSKIMVNGRAREFPSFEQRTFLHHNKEYGTRLLAAKAGLGKTATAYLAMENTDAKRVLILAPADSKAWPSEYEKIFKPKTESAVETNGGRRRKKSSGDIFVVRGSHDLDAAMRSGKKYIVVSQKLLGRAKQGTPLFDMLEQLVQDGEIDGAVIDELDNLNKFTAESSAAALRLIQSIRQGYAARRPGKEEKDAPVLGLTATPIRNSLANLDLPMAMLYPDRFVATNAQADGARTTFSLTCLRRPDLAHALLVGENLMMRWEEATDVQKFEYAQQVVEVTEFERYLYTFIANEVPVSPINKIRLLENALFNPLLVKAEVREAVKKRVDEPDLDQLKTDLIEVLREWKKKVGKDHPDNDDEKLSASRLVELGLGPQVLACFLSEVMGNGIETYIEEIAQHDTDPQLRELFTWWKKEEVSSRYSYVKKLLERELRWRKNPETGVFERRKVFIVSPSRKQGRTADVQHRIIMGEDGDLHQQHTDEELGFINDVTLVKLIKEWTKDLCGSDCVLVIDGDTEIGATKDAIIQRWKEDPNAAVMIATLESTYQSRDFMVSQRAVEQGRELNGVLKVFLTPPWHAQQLEQMVGRSMRQGQTLPVEVMLCMTSDFVDRGKADAVLYTYLLSRIALAGIALTPQEKEFFSEQHVGNRSSLKSADSRFLKDTFFAMRGAGEDRILRNFRQVTTGLEINDLVENVFATRFHAERKDEFRTTGYNAELVAKLIDHLTYAHSKVLSLGAGTLLLQRKLQRGIDNVDVNMAMMNMGWPLAEQYGGRMYHGRASTLEEEEFPDSTYDVVDSAFCLDWSKLYGDEVRRVEDSERVKILLQMNRVLKIGGYAMITLPEHALSAPALLEFNHALEKHFGYSIVDDFTGESYGRSRYGVSKRLGWCIVAKKIGEPDLTGLKLKALTFANETEEWESRASKRQNSRSVPVDEYPVPTQQVILEQFEIMDARGNPTAVPNTRAELEVSQPDFQSRAEQSDTSVTHFAEASSRHHELADLIGSSAEEYKNGYRKMLLRPALEYAGLTMGDREQVEVEFVKILSTLTHSDILRMSRLKLLSFVLQRFKKVKKRK